MFRCLPPKVFQKFLTTTRPILSTVVIPQLMAHNRGYTATDHNDVIVRALKRHELKVFSQLADEAGWGWFDEHIFEVGYNLDPNGFLVAELRDSGEIIGTINGLNINERRSHGSMWYVKEKYRFNGVGKMLKKVRLKHMGDRDLQIFSVPERVEANMKSGFKHAIHKHAMYLGQIQNTPLSAQIRPDDFSIVAFSDCDEVFDAVAQYDEGIVATRRASLLKALLSVANSYSYVALSDDGRVIGFIHLHPVRDCYRIFPWAGDNENIALALFNEVCKLIGCEDRVFIDSPVGNRVVEELAKVHQWHNFFSGLTYVCTDKVAPRIQVDKLYANSFASIM